MPEPSGLLTFDHAAGVPIHYARTEAHPYGTIGKGPRRVRLLSGFFIKLEHFLFELWGYCGMGCAKALVSGGCYVDKPGMHGEGRAIDIDALWWKDIKLITQNYPGNEHLYLAIESVIRKHFGTVLGYLYNKAHEDHWHIDDGSPVWFRKSSKSRTIYVQSTITHIFKNEIGIDGDYGTETETAVQEILGELSVETKNLEDVSTWFAFLDAAALVGFGKVEKDRRDK